MTKPHTTLSEAVRALTPPPRKGQSHVLFDDGYDEGFAKAIQTVADMVEQHEAQEPVAQPSAELSNALWCDLRTDADRCNWLLLGRGFDTGVIAKELQNHVAMAYHKLSLAQPTLAATQADEGREAQVLRRLLAYNVAGAKLYTDDGELKDSSTWPHIDFRRDSVDTIEDKLGKRMLAAFVKMAPEHIIAALPPTTTRSE